MTFAIYLDIKHFSAIFGKTFTGAGDADAGP